MNRKMIKALCVWIVVLVCFFSLFACAQVPEGEVQNKYAIVVKSEGNPYFKVIIDGFLEVIEGNGDVVIVKEPEAATPEEQINIINQLISENVDCIAIAGNSEDALQSSLTNAMEKGIKVISFDSAVNKDSRLLHVNQADGEQVGKALAEAANEITGGEGQIAILSTTNQAHNQNTWIKWMREELEEGVYPGLALVDIV